MNKNIYILGIYPDSEFATYDLYNKTCPLGLLTLLYKYRDNSIVYDEQISGSVLKKDNLLNSVKYIFISVNVANIKRGLYLAKVLIGKGKYVFLGGPEVSMIGPSLLDYHPYITGIVLGTGESVIEDIFNWDDSSGRVFFSKNINKNNKLFNEYKPLKSRLEFSTIRIHYDMLYDYHKYKGLSYLWGNDCSQAKNRCYFCGRTSMGVGYRNSEIIWNELLEQYRNGIKFFYNTTDSVTTRLKSFVEFCERKPKEIKEDAVHRVFVNAHQVNDILINSLKKINGIAVLGIESFGNINSAGKIGATEQGNLIAIEKLYKAGVKFVISFVYGLPNDTSKSLDYNSMIIKELVYKYGAGIESIHISPLLITTGSKAYEELFANQKIKNKYLEKKLPYNYIELSEDYFNLFCNIKRKETIKKIFELYNFIKSYHPSISFYAKGLLKTEIKTENMVTTPSNYNNATSEKYKYELHLE